MSVIDDVLEGMGIGGGKIIGKRSKGIKLPFGLPNLPDPGEIKESLEGVVSSISGLKEIPKDAIDHLVEADRDFKEADKALRSTRLRTKK